MGRCLPQYGRPGLSTCAREAQSLWLRSAFRKARGGEAVCGDGLVGKERGPRALLEEGAVTNRAQPRSYPWDAYT